MLFSWRDADSIKPDLGIQLHKDVLLKFTTGCYRQTDSCLTDKNVFNIKQAYLLLCSETGAEKPYKHANMRETRNKTWERHVTKPCGPPVRQTYCNWKKEIHVNVSMINTGAVSPFKEPQGMYTAWPLVKNVLNEIWRPLLILFS
jgi:hypothetical protein